MNLNKLVIDYKNGNEIAFDKIYNSTINMVKCAIVTYIKDNDVILDLCQETYMTFVNNIDKYENISINNYLYTIAKNKAIDYLKKKKELLIDNYDNLNSDSINPYINFALNKLEDEEREVFFLKVLVGYSTKKIALSLNKDPYLVNKLYYDAKDKLKKELGGINEIK